MAKSGGSESPPNFNEPEARYDASAAAIGKEVFMYRGYLDSYRGKLFKVSPPSHCEVFDTTVFQWSKRNTYGSNPKAWQSSSIAVYQHRIFYYGGWSGRDYTNELFELDTLASSMKWIQHRPKNPKKGPRKKEGSGFIVLPGGKELCLFAGYGVPVGRDPPGTESLKDKYWDGRGWTNEIHCYHLADAEWSCPVQTGQRPPPCVAVTFTRVDARRVVVFAGKAAQRRVRDVHILDISIWHWSGVILPLSTRQPEGRCYHTAYSLWDPDSNPQNPSLVVTSGLSEDAQTLGDLWVFEVNGLTWEELELPGSRSIGRRMQHSGGLVYTSETTRLLVTNGGIPAGADMFKNLKDYCIISETAITELVYSEEAAARGSCGWSVASVMKNGSKVVMAGQEAAVTVPGKERPKHDENSTDRKLKLEFDVMELLGKGGFGVVYRVKSKLDNGEYALKIIKLPTSKKQEKEVKREVDALMGLDHSRILRYFQSWPARILDPVILKSFEIKEDPLACAELSHYDLPAGGGGLQSAGDSSREDNEGDEQPRSKNPLCLFIQTQLCRNDTLKDWLLKNMRNRPKDMVFDYFGQILEAVVYIHSKGLLHRDLKPSNIFFSQDGGIKVGDFGLVAGNISPEQSSQEQFHSGQVGTRFYMAPEQLSGQKYDQKVDIFALGVIFLELNYPPTAKERDQVHSDLRYKFELPKRFTEESPVEAALAKKLLNREAVKRPSAKDVLEELQGLKATLSGQASSSGQSFATSTQGTSPKTLQDSVSTGREMDTTDSGVGISPTQGSGGPSSVEGVPRETPHYQPSVGAHHQNLDITDSGVAGTHDAPITTLAPQLPGIHFLGTPYKENVTSEGQEITWDNIGAAFSIPPGAVPRGKSLELVVHPTLTGPFQLPDYCELTSPSYLITHSREFAKDVEIIMYHSVHLRTDDDCKRMTFLLAPETPEFDGTHHRYKFKKLRGGVFQKNESFGKIKLRHFGHLAIGITGDKPPSTYSARLYRNSATPGGPCTRAAFCIVPNQPMYTEHLSKYLEKTEPGLVNCVPSISEPVEFALTSATPKVTLELPGDVSGYRITSDPDPPQITKKKVDYVLTSSKPPEDYPMKLFLNVLPVGERVSPESCKLTVLGLDEDLSFTLTVGTISMPLPESDAEFKSASVHVSRAYTADELLSVEDFHVVYDHVYHARLKWQPIGDRLRLCVSDLENYGNENRTNDQCLRKVILEWLRQRNLRPCWKALIEALRHQTVGEEEVAHDLQEWVMKQHEGGHKAVETPELENVQPADAQREVPGDVTHSVGAVPDKSSGEVKETLAGDAKEELLTGGGEEPPTDLREEYSEPSSSETGEVKEMLAGDAKEELLTGGMEEPPTELREQYSEPSSSETGEVKETLAGDAKEELLTGGMEEPPTDLREEYSEPSSSEAAGGLALNDWRLVAVLGIVVVLAVVLFFRRK